MPQSKWNVSLLIVYLLCAALLADDVYALAANNDFSMTIAMLQTEQGKASNKQNRSIIEAVESQLVEFGVRVDVTTVAEFPQGDGRMLKENARRLAKEKVVPVVFWCTYDAEVGAQLNLYVSSPDGEWMIQRDLKLRSEEGLAEKLAIILSSTVYLALVDAKASQLSGSGQTEDAESNPLQAYFSRQSQASSEQKMSAEKEVAPYQRQRDFAPIRLSGGYLLGVTSGEAILAHGVDLAAGVRITDRFSAFAGYTLFGRIEHAEYGSKISVWRHPLKLGAELEFRRKRWTLGGIVAAVFDYATWESETVSVTMDSDEKGAELQISALSLITGTFVLLDRWQLFIALGIETFVKRPRYTVRTPTDRIAVYNPWPVQPVALVGAFFNIL